MLAGAANAAAGKTYVLFEGTILETVLINRLEGQFSGPVECLLSTDVYSNDRQHLLDSRRLEAARRNEEGGYLRPDPSGCRLPPHRSCPTGIPSASTSSRGSTRSATPGLRDQVNNHYLRIFGVSLAIGALGAVGEAGTARLAQRTGGDLMRQGFAQSTAQSSAQILDKFLNVMPTVTIREGHRVKVYLSGDLALPDYNNHKMPSDL